MEVLKDKCIVAGISGGIAAYKAAGVVSKLAQAGAEMRVIMTRAACEFVTPLTFEALSRRKVLTDLFRDDPSLHIELAYRAELFVLMPATYNLIGKLANGLADDFLTTTLAATRAPVLVVPSMESQMYTNPIFQQNKRKLEALGYRFLEPEVGHLASGRSGIGRFPAEEKILQAIETIFTERALLQGCRVLVTAGPTREMLDPMRCLTNKSSGKMGYALAEQARNCGAEVCLISGPTQLEPPTGVEFVRVESAEQMRDTVLKRAPKFDLIVMAAAVADWRPKKVLRQKLKKASTHELTLILERTPDILAELGRRKKKNQILIGFAAETEKLLEQARQKLKEKNLDLVVANDITAPGAGPESETNIATLLYRDGRSEALPCLPKRELAAEILRRVMKAP